MQKKLLQKLSDSILINYDPADLEKYGRDWTQFHQPNPLGIAFPKSTEEVQKIIQFANEHKIALVPSGGRTGLSGGAVASNGELVVSLEKMNHILNFNKTNQTLTTQAGAITEEIQNFAKEKGLFYPVDFASRGSSQIGGNVATNAGGIKVIRYGLTRRQVLGLMIVTGKGDILNLNNGLLKNATGYDLRHLFIGSEGTLGIITEVTLQLTRPPKNLQTIFFGVSSVENILDILKIFKNKIQIAAFEFLSGNALDFVVEKAHLQKPFKEKYNYYVLIEYELISDTTENTVHQTIIRLYEKNLIENDMIGNEETERQRIWDYREKFPQTFSGLNPYKNDISVLTSDIPEFIKEAQEVIGENYPDFTVFWHGHIADGNLHINILKSDNLSVEDFKRMGDEVSQKLFEIIKKYKGSISAEHGVGLTKKKFLHYTRSKTEIEYLKSIKKILDPNQILNPGKVF